jgi:DNA-binding MarR family transcriptional regulator
MFGAVKKRITTLAADAYAVVDLGSMQAKLIRQIGKHERMSQAELARATASDPTLTGRALATLIERGLVRRERSDEDRREYVLELSAAGRRSRDQVERLRGKLAARIGEALDDRDLEDFERIAAKLLVALEAPFEAS